jgi:hypothetical protein
VTWRSTGSAVVEWVGWGVLERDLVDPALVWPVGIREMRGDGSERDGGGGRKDRVMRRSLNQTGQMWQRIINYTINY